MMRKTNTVSEYLSTTPAHARRYLKQIRAIVRAIAPRATESISYGIPTFKLDGHPLVFYAAFKDHVSLYPMTGAIRRAFADQLKGYKTSTGTIQFPLDKKLPTTLIRRLVKARLAEHRKQWTR